jgi:hypothetical protein
MSLAPSTWNLQAAALFTFYDWIIAEYLPANSVPVSLTENPLTHPRRKRSLRQEMAGLMDCCLIRCTQSEPGHYNEPTHCKEAHLDMDL